jgi:hypothetical protein
MTDDLDMDEIDVDDEDLEETIDEIKEKIQNLTK